MVGSRSDLLKNYCFDIVSFAVKVAVSFGAVGEICSEVGMILECHFLMSWQAQYSLE